MRILCVIDSLGSGGAQRQMVHLALGLKAKGHDVEMLVYFPELRFFRPEIDAAGIPVHEVAKSGQGFSSKIVNKIMALFRSGNYHGAISFLRSPNIYCELAKVLSFSDIRLVVSERSSFNGDAGSFRQELSRYLHAIASSVVANSYTQARWLETCLWLQQKTHVIYNGYPIPELVSGPRSDTDRNYKKYLVIGRINAGKNGVRLIEALAENCRRSGSSPAVSWAGRQEKDPASLRVRDMMERLLSQHPHLAEKWRWLGERKDIPQLLQQCDALFHVSLHEGLPNAICEAFIAGRPVIASNVCDHPRLVEDGARGVLCDPSSIDSICSAIERFESMSNAGRALLGQNARKYAVEHLSSDRMVAKYEALLRPEGGSSKRPWE